MADQSSGLKIIADNRQANYQYHILETYEAGLELLGTEVKSIRNGRVNLRDGYALIKNGELWLLNVHISPHQSASAVFNHEPLRNRRLLLNRREINKLIGKVEQQGLTLVPLKMYLKRGWIKIVIGLAQGKKLHDKRESLKRKQSDREIERVLKTY